MLTRPRRASVRYSGQASACRLPAQPTASALSLLRGSRLLSITGLSKRNFKRYIIERCIVNMVISYS